MFNVYIVSICVFFRKGKLNLEPRSVVCPAPSSLVFCVLFKCIFSLVFFSIVIMVKAIK